MSLRSMSSQNEKYVEPHRGILSNIAKIENILEIGYQFILRSKLHNLKRRQKAPQNNEYCEQRIKPLINVENNRLGHYCKNQENREVHECHEHR